MNNTNDTTAADQPSAPNGVSKETPVREAPQVPVVTKGVSKGASSSSKKKHKKGRQHDLKLPPAKVESTISTDAAPVEAVEESAGESIEEGAAVLIEESATAPIEEGAAPVEEPTTAPIEVSIEGLKLRMKVWTNPETAKRYLMPSAFMRDLVNGQPMSDVMYAYAMRDDDTKLVTLTASEWNALPFYYFQEDGPAPRATTRPIDVIFSREGTV